MFRNYFNLPKKILFKVVRTAKIINNILASLLISQVLANLKWKSHKSLPKNLCLQLNRMIELADFEHYQNSVPYILYEKYLRSFFL